MAVQGCLRGVLIDLSGTIHIENCAICGAADALKRLRKTCLKIRFVTNTTKESKRILWERLTNLGFSIEQDEIFTSLTAAHEVVCRKNLRPQLLLEDEALEDFPDTNTKNPNAVVVGLAPSKFNFNTLNDAFSLLKISTSWELWLKRMQCMKESLYMHEDVRDDIDGSQRAGLVGMLVKTGKYREGDELKISPSPNYVFENFPAAVDFIINHLT
ncbi:haloacid dehalogenase-like hydrolase domain-containing protein 2 [Tachypleus tridentatus]|uniref:haloacid dehalogenase-like hydrolase domain-containing protein 2 n=1 Tax=Tachypleus tridentatus TaxID=6853 RepID=UPI003FD02AE2